MTHNDNAETKIMPRVPVDAKTEVLPRVQGDDDTVVISPIIAQVMEASVRQTQDVTNALIGNLQYQEAELRATVELIREAIAEITSRPYVVNPQVYLQAMWPNKADIEARMRLNGYQKG